MMLRAKLWIASKVRRVAGIEELGVSLSRIEARLDVLEARLRGFVEDAESRLNKRLDVTVSRLNETLMETVTHAATRIDGSAQRRNDAVERADPASGLTPDDRLQLVALIDTTVLGVQRARLRDRHGPIEIETNNPVAYESPDHLVPWGTKRDNSREQRFNARLINLIQGDHLSLLDLGCSGGGLVRSMIEQGYLAVGVEGSDYSQRWLRAEWLTIPDFLFTADITKPFRFETERTASRLRFAVVTLWEVIEHIAEPDLPALFSNIDAHLMRGGLVILSVSPNSDVIEGVELHQTIQQRPWWAEYFASAGWVDNPAIIASLGDDMVRWEANAPNSFHFALSRAGETPILTRRTLHLAANRELASEAVEPRPPATSTAS